MMNFQQKTGNKNSEISKFTLKITLRSVVENIRSIYLFQELHH